MIYLEKTDIYSTLTTWIYCHMWMKWSLEQQGKQTYINWPEGKSLIDLYDKKKFNEEPNMFHWYFKQDINELQEIEEILTWESWQDPTSGGLMAQQLNIIKEYYKRNLHFNAATNRRGQELVEKYNIDFENTIGITWRGTDVYLDGRPRIPIETYYQFIDEILAHSPTMRIMCTAEEDKILDPLLARYPQAFKVHEFYQAPFESKHNPERFSPMSGYERGLQPVLMVWLFSKCKHYIKNRSSAAAVASWLSNGRIVSIAHPENLGFPANTNTAEIEGKLYPLNLNI